MVILQRDIDFARKMGINFGLEGVSIVDIGNDIRGYEQVEKDCLHNLAFRYALVNIQKQATQY